MESITNFRDLGVYKNKDGRALKTGLIYRSGELVDISKRDRLKLLGDLGLKTIVDFRSQEERDLRPDDRLEGTDYRSIDIMKDFQNNSASFADMLTSEKTADATMFEIYENLLDPSCLEGYREFFQLLLDLDKTALVFHCFAGKDRTGVAAALFLKLLDVEDRLIVLDYMKTNELRRSTNERERASLREEGYEEAELNKAMELLYVKEAYLEDYFKNLNRLYGSFTSFRKKELGISDSDLAKLKDNYLE